LLTIADPRFRCVVGEYTAHLAETHLQVTDADFDWAADTQSGAKCGALVAQLAQNAVQAPRVRKCSDSQELSATAANCTVFAITSESQQFGAQGLNGEDRIRTCGRV
jgi:hypothetical protein